MVHLNTKKLIDKKNKLKWCKTDTDFTQKINVNSRSIYVA